jgi:hypothetical protein
MISPPRQRRGEAKIGIVVVRLEAFRCAQFGNGFIHTAEGREKLAEIAVHSGLRSRGRQRTTVKFFGFRGLALEAPHRSQNMEQRGIVRRFRQRLRQESSGLNEFIASEKRCGARDRGSPVGGRRLRDLHAWKDLLSDIASIAGVAAEIPVSCEAATSAFALDETGKGSSRERQDSRRSVDRP